MPMSWYHVDITLPHDHVMIILSVARMEAIYNQLVYLYKCMHEMVAPILELAAKVSMHMCVLNSHTLLSIHHVISSHTAPVLNNTAISHKVVFHSDGTPYLHFKFRVG